MSAFGGLELVASGVSAAMIISIVDEGTRSPILVTADSGDAVAGVIVAVEPPSCVLVTVVAVLVVVLGCGGPSVMAELT